MRRNRGKTVKKSWSVAVGVAAVVVCLAGCDGGMSASREVQAGSVVAPSGTSKPVVVTWQPVDKTDEFLSAWRPKD
jgi:hypothetical protein